MLTTQVSSRSPEAKVRRKPDILVGPNDWIRPKLIRPSSVIGALLLLSAASVIAWWFLRSENQLQERVEATSALTLTEIPFDGQAAFRTLEQICALGPRPSGSVGMLEQQRMLEEHYTQLGGQVTYQRFDQRHPETGERVPMANMIITWHPDRNERILLAAHYDTRPFADRDPDPAKRTAPLLGANDGASGVAVLAEMARHMPSLPGRLGVDFVLFDAEEFVFVEKRDPYFLGSRYFASDYVASRPKFRYRAAVVLDMVGDRDLQIYQEEHGVTWRDSRWIVQGIWGTARRLGVQEFIPKIGYRLEDDHVPLHDIGKIPACDIIDFEYPRRGLPSYWHTTHDTPDKCSPLSLAKVGWVVLEWLRELSRTR